ncbi:MAG: hypothetical protein LBV73_00650 [Paraburkholderia sp.]|nr:hypothetical protein [Paraburkholderia sp.]
MLESFNLIGYVLQFRQPNPAEKRLMERVERVDTGPGRQIAFVTMPRQLQHARRDGIYGNSVQKAICPPCNKDRTGAGPETLMKETTETARRRFVP